MVVRNRIVSLVRIDVGDWAPAPDLGRADEAVTLVAHLSDGTTVERRAVVAYASGEREKVLEAMVHEAVGRKAEEAVRIGRLIVDRRNRAVQTARGDLQREYACRIVAA